MILNTHSQNRHQFGKPPTDIYMNDVNVDVNVNYVTLG